MVPLMHIGVDLVVVLENIVVGILLDILVPGTVLVSSAGSVVALKSVDGLVSQMSLVHSMLTSLLTLSKRHTSRFQSQKDFLVSGVCIILRPFLLLLLLLMLLLLLLLGVKLNSTARSMPVSVLVSMVAVLMVLVAVQLSWPGKVGLVARLQLMTLVAL